jgi:predicted hydrocarbon binding protein
MQEQTIQHHSWGVGIHLVNDNHSQSQSYRCPKAPCRIKAESKRIARDDKLVGFIADPPKKSYASDKIYIGIYECSDCKGMYWNHIDESEIKLMKVDGRWPTDQP